MRRPAVLAATILAVSGCGADSTNLAGFGPTRVDVGTRDFFNSAAGAADVTLSPLGDDCPTIDAGATAALNGLPMSLVVRGGLEERDQGEFCNSVIFALPVEPGDISSATVGRGASATIVISDAGTTWTIAVEGFLTTDIAMIGTPTTNGNIALSWPQAGTSICDNNLPCWNPGVVFFDGAGKLVTYWERDPTLALPEIFTPMGSDWRLALSWATSASSMKPQTGMTQGSLVMVGYKRGASASVCDGPSECHAQIESASVYSATLF